MGAFGSFEGELEVRYLKRPKRRWWLRWLPQRRRWLVTRSFTWHGGDLVPCCCMSVLVGTVIDFASIPFLFVWALGPMNGWTSDYGRGAAIHDELYQHGAAMVPPVSRAQADLVLYYAIRCEDGWWLTAYVMWAAVRLFGWTAYQRPRG